MKNLNQLDQFDQLKSKELTNVWCIHGGAAADCGDCCKEDDPRGGTKSK